MPSTLPAPIDKLAIVVVTYKRQELLANLFDSMTELTATPWRIVIVDNENSRETEAMCAAFNERLANLWGIDTEQPDAQGGTDRVIYAPQLENGGGAGGFDFSGFGGMGGFESIFDTFFGGMGGSARRAGPVQGNDLQHRITITFEEAAFGCEKSVDFFRNENCDACGGTGAKPGTQPQTCPTCKGSGQVRTGGGFMVTVRTCPTCHGEGKIIKDRCQTCGGTGRVRRKRSLKLRIPAGIQDGVSLVKRGEGEPGMRGGPAGDLYITVTVKPHRLFKRDGNNILLDMPISITQAALGAEIDVPTLEKPVKQRIPEGTQTGTQFRIKGQGIPSLKNGLKGDLILTVHVEVPRKLNERQKDLLRQLEQSLGGKEYEGRKTFADKIKEIFNN